MKILRKNIIGFILGGIIFGSLSITIASQILATQVSYSNEKSTSNVTSVDGALTELYGLAEECQNASSGSTIEYKGTAVEAIYLDPTGNRNDCSSSNFKSDTETKSGCMRFWKYAEDSEYKYTILDHNTTGAGLTFFTAQSKVKEDTKEWNPNLQARNISAYEIYKITESTNGVTNWQINGSKSLSFSKNPGYDWLFDRTNNCKSNGCTTTDNNVYNSSRNYGYWTSDAQNSSDAWRVYSTGSLNTTSFDNSGLGVRPVIKIAK